MTTPLAAKIAREYGTPVAVIDMDRVERNIARVQKACDAAGLANRPHIKTHKSPILAKLQIEAGAKGYIAKNDDPTLFAGAVKTVANGGRYLHPEMARRIAFLRADPSPDALSNLSSRELEILRLLAAGRTMAQIADLLNVSYKTIANNCTRLKQKLGARSAMDLMRIAIDARG